MLRGNVAAFLKKDIEAAVTFYRASIAVEPRWDAHYFLGRVLAPTKPDERSRYETVIGSDGAIGRSARTIMTAASASYSHSAFGSHE